MKMVIQRLTLLVLLCLVNTFGFARITKVDSLSIRIVDVETQLRAERQAILILQKEEEIYEKSLRCIDEHVDRVNEEISNQVALSSHTIQVWGVDFYSSCDISFYRRDIIYSLYSQDEQGYVTLNI